MPSSLKPEAFGDPVDWNDLRGSRARAVARLVCKGDTQGYKFVEARRSPTGEETLIAHVHVGRPQRSVHALKAVEPIALYFPREDRAPVIFSFRGDFPDVPHTNPGYRSDPVSLCIDDRPWSEAKLNWTPSDFLVRIQIWLAKTARGELHGDARAPEPLFVAPGPVLIVERAAIEAAHAAPIDLAVFRPDFNAAREVLVAMSGSLPPAALGRIALIALTAPSHEMGPLRFPPRNFGELCSELASTDVRGLLKQRIREWVSKAWSGSTKPKHNPDQLGWRLGLLIGFPIEGEGVDGIGITDLKVFFTTISIAEIGVALGCLDKDPDGLHGWLLSPGDGRAADNIALVCGEVHYGHDRQLATSVSGHETTDERRAVLVGAGTVGSHVSTNLAREGLFKWSVIDDDYLLPHNVPRHVLLPAWIGHAKAEVVARHLDAALGGAGNCEHLNANVLSVEPATRNAVDAMLGRADIIMDASASIAVSRLLSSTPGTDARRISFFFNSDGTDAVLQIEPSDRSASLRELEAQHYAMTVIRPDLAGHLRASQDTIAFSGACRQATNRMPEGRAALLSALIAIEIETALRCDCGSITIWRTNGATVHTIKTEAAKWRHLSIADWKIVLSEDVVDMFAERRQAQLPAETGGVLLGVVDMEARSIHVSAALDAPPDSRGDPSGFERGVAGLRAQIVAASDASAGQLVYVGEWHSHPQGYASTPSPKDLLQLAELAGLLDMNGVPALMAIANDGGTRIHCASIRDVDEALTIVIVKEARK